MEEYACVLDILPEGRPDDRRQFRREAIIYGLGVDEFKIFEMAPIPGAVINIGDRVFIGKETEERKQIERVRARVSYAELTHTAQSELGFLLEELVLEQEEKFIEFYNHAGPISRRYHSLELLPGLGKKTMEAVLAHRPYTSFAEVEEKVSNLRHPEKLIAARIEHEIREPEQKYRLFVRKPSERPAVFDSASDH